MQHETGVVSSHAEKDICTALVDCYSSIQRLLRDQHVTSDVAVANMEDRVNRLLERYGDAYLKTWTLELKDIDDFFNRVVLSKEYDQGKLKPATEYYEQFIGEARKLAAYMKSPKDKQVVFGPRLVADCVCVAASNVFVTIMLLLLLIGSTTTIMPIAWLHVTVLLPSMRRSTNTTTSTHASNETLTRSPTN
jgi:hypothetical protein